MNTSNHEQDPFEDFFSDRFKDFEADTDDVLWKNIKTNLPASQTPKYWLWSSIALLLLLTSTSLWFWKDDLLKKTTTASTSVAPKIIAATTEPRVDAPQTHTVAQPAKKAAISMQANVPSLKPIRNETVAKTLKLNKPSKPDTHTESTVTLAEIKQLPAKTTDIDNALPPVKTTYEEEALINPNNNDFVSEQEHREVAAEDNLGVISTAAETTEEMTKSVFQVDMLEGKAFHKPLNELSMPEVEWSHPILTKNKYYKKPITIDIFGSGMPLVNYYTITSNETSDAWQVHNINVQNSRLGAFAQLGLQIGFSDKWRVRGSVAYTRLRQIIVDYKVRLDSLIVRQGESPEVAYLDVSKKYFNPKHYLALRLDVQYDFLKTKAFHHYVSLGLEVNTVLFGRVNHNAFANISYGISRQMTPKITFFAEPIFGYALQKEQDSRYITIRPNRFGLNMGLSYKIK